MLKLCLLVLLLVVREAFAQNPVFLHADATVHRLAANDAEVWRDVERDKTLGDVLALQPAFKPAPMPFNGGYTRDVYWFRLRVRRDDAAPGHWLLAVNPAYLDDVRLYTPSAQGYVEQRAGDLVPAARRPADKIYGSYAFSLDLPDSATRALYLRVQTTSASTVELTLATPEAQAARLSGQNLLLGLTLGALLTIAANALMLWHWLRQTWCLSFLGYVLGGALLFFARDGAAARYWLENWPQLANLLTPIGTCVFMGFAPAFFIGFFDVRRYFPFSYRLFWGLTALSALALLSLCVDAYVYVAPWLILYSLLLMPGFLYVAWRVTRLNFTGGRVIFLGYVINNASSIISLLAMNNLIPANMLMQASSQWGLLIYLLFLQQGMYQRVRSVEQQQREADLRATVAERLADSEKQRRQEQAMFLNIVAHELKTPLAVIDSAVQTLEAQAQDGNALVSKRHERIRHAVSNLNNLLENALSVERYDNAPLQPRIAPIALDRFLEQTVQRTVPETRVCEIQLAPHSVCLADRTLVHLALSNLLVNAVKYSPADSPLWVRAAPERRDGRQGILLCVDSHYHHPDKPDCEPWFGKYYRQHERPNIEGLGLGLYLVREIARTHQGNAEGRVIPMPKAWLISMCLWLPHPTDEEYA